MLYYGTLVRSSIVILSSVTGVCETHFRVLLARSNPYIISLVFLTALELASYHLFHHNFELDEYTLRLVSVPFQYWKILWQRDIP